MRRETLHLATQYSLLATTLKTERLNAYRIMWIMVLFDLPTETKQDKKNYTDFRKKMQKDGFTMFQFSAYLRHCASRENMEVHVKRIQKNLPPRGHVGILTVTDKQFGMMQVFYGGVEKEKAPVPQQLELF